jgi:hypothetical protein
VRYEILDTRYELGLTEKGNSYTIKINKKGERNAHN